MPGPPPPPPPPPGGAPPPLRPKVSTEAPGAELGAMSDLPEAPVLPPEELEIKGLGQRPLRVALMSDTHVEFYGASQAVNPGGDHCPPEADVLVLAGDIGIPKEGGSEYENLIHAQSQRYPYVLVVLGNHEFYNGEYEARRKLAEQVCRSAPLGNVRLLDCHSVVFNRRWWFGGCTLWSSIPEQARQAVGRGLTDYAVIRWKREGEPDSRIKVADTNAWHRRELAWLGKAVKQAREMGLQAAVVTHHAPLLRGISHPRHEGHSAESNPIGHAFGTDLTRSGVLGDPVRLWMFGHTHYSTDATVDGVRVVSNQVGYPHERDQRYRQGLVVELPAP
eukprot:Hpha_TRINITY_DN15565_c4_g4::TRINITY_DN15565_c4_g4_i1::g.108000::m.108000